MTPSVFNTWLTCSSDQHNYATSRQSNLIKSSYRTYKYAKYSIIAIAVDSWNKVKKKFFKNTLLKDLSLNNIKTVLSNFFKIILITFIHHEIIYTVFS